MSAILQYTTTSTFDCVWLDGGSHAEENAGFWRPRLNPGQWTLGDYAQGNYDAPYTSAWIIDKVINDDAANPALVAPSSYTAMWWYQSNDHGQGGYNVVWQANAPDGYVACGNVVSNTGPLGNVTVPDQLPQPIVTNFACVRSDLVIQAPGTDLISVWNDHGDNKTGFDISAYMQPRLYFLVAVKSLDARPNYFIPANIPK